MRVNVFRVARVETLEALRERAREEALHVEVQEERGPDRPDVG